MIVNYFDDCDCRYSFSVNTTILLSRKRLVARFENQPVGVHEINCILFVSFTLELLSPVRAAFRNQLQRSGSSQDGKAIHDCLRHAFAVFLLKLLRRVTYFLKFSVLESNIHKKELTITKSVTYYYKLLT